MHVPQPPVAIRPRIQSALEPVPQRTGPYAAPGGIHPSPAQQSTRSRSGLLALAMVVAPPRAPANATKDSPEIARAREALERAWKLEPGGGGGGGPRDGGDGGGG